MKKILVCLLLLTLFSGCTKPNRTKNQESKMTFSTNSSTEGDRYISFVLNEAKDRVTITNKSTDIITIHQSETVILKKDGEDWVQNDDEEYSGKSLLYMTFNIQSGESSDYDLQIPFDTGTIKVIFMYSAGQKEYLKEIIFEK